MASKRRGGGFRPPELRGTLGTLLRTAWQQAGGVRDVLERGARQGRERLDALRSDRRRDDLLAELGEAVLQLIRRGEIDPEELPEIHDVVQELDELDASEPSPDDDVATPPTRQRFDDRGTEPRDRTARTASARGRGEDDGTVSSGRWSPPRPGRPTNVWRPPVASKAGPEDAPDRAAPIPPIPRPSDPLRRGGISFDDDDLADYMHPDDVAPKDPPDRGDS